MYWLQEAASWTRTTVCRAPVLLIVVHGFLLSHVFLSSRSGIIIQTSTGATTRGHKGEGCSTGQGTTSFKFHASPHRPGRPQDTFIVRAIHREPQTHKAGTAWQRQASWRQLRLQLQVPPAIGPLGNYHLILSCAALQPSLLTRDGAVTSSGVQHAIQYAGAEPKTIRFTAYQCSHNFCNALAKCKDQCTHVGDLAGPLWYIGSSPQNLGMHNCNHLAKRRACGISCERQSISLQSLSTASIISPYIHIQLQCIANAHTLQVTGNSFAGIRMSSLSNFVSPGKVAGGGAAWSMKQIIPAVSSIWQVLWS